MTLRLHLNEHTGGCSPIVEQALRAMTRVDTACYPDEAPATRAAERWFGVPTDWVQLTNGLDEGLMIAALAAARRNGDGVARFIEPAFDLYPMVAGAAGLTAEAILSGPDFAFPLAAMIATTTRRPDLIILNDPNNPTGLGLPDGAVDTICRERSDAIVLLDEAYAEFSGRTAIGPLLDQHPNLVVGRTFAKAFGLAGLRIGALVAHPDTLAELRRVLMPFTVNVFALRGLEAALEDRQYAVWTVAQAAASRQVVYDFCRARQLTYWQSETNFVLIRVGDDAPEVVAEAAERGLLLRDRSRVPGCAGCIRITAGVVDDTRAGLKILEDTLASRAR
jgi:histidinol-phosphate aminotransferase